MTFSDASGGRSLSDLLGGLASDISGLFRKEIELAKTEASEKLDVALSAAKTLAIGVVLAIGAIGVFLAALVAGVGYIFVNMGIAEPLASFLAAIIIAAIVGAIAWTMISRGSAALSGAKLNMNRTAHAIRSDANAVKESF